MSKKVLIVEDSDDSRHFMKILLELSGYEVIEAINGQEAVDAVKRDLPDLVLMDMSMPVMDGISATRIIRKDENSATLPIIAVTAFGASYQRIAIEAGCNALIPKPVEFNTLQPVLEHYLA
jgi:CheY-like chemotaxis protein